MRGTTYATVHERGTGPIEGAPAVGANGDHDAFGPSGASARGRARRAREGRGAKGRKGAVVAAVAGPKGNTAVAPKLGTASPSAAPRHSRAPCFVGSTVGSTTGSTTGGAACRLVAQLRLLQPVGCKRGDAWVEGARDVGPRRVRHHTQLVPAAAPAAPTIQTTVVPTVKPNTVRFSCNGQALASSIVCSRAFAVEVKRVRKCVGAVQGGKGRSKGPSGSATEQKTTSARTLTSQPHR